MSKFTKISATALFALFLTACDQKTAEVAPAPKEEAVQTAAAEPAQMEASVAVEDVQGAADFQKFVEWKLEQEKVLTQAQTDLQESINTQDKNVSEKAVADFKAKIAEALKSLDELEIKTPEVNEFKADARLSLVLSGELLDESLKMAADPKPESQQLIQEKAEKLMQLGASLQQKQTELQNKYAK